MSATPAGEVVVRCAKPPDVQTLHGLIGELAEYERLSAEFVADPEVLERFLFGDRPAAEALVAELDDKPAGFALYFQTFSTFLGRPGLYLEDLYVRRRYRGRGVGRSLLREVARLAVERGCGRLEWAVLNWNEPAIGFYERLGASPLSEWTTYRMTGEALAEFAGE